ncbi:MAG: FumA C-terminus/TtdB family hydratase beta subunit [Candidatus Omnitrophota bacterium]
MKKLTIPLSKEAIASLRAGDEALLSGVIYTARDQAHAKLAGLIRAGKKLPFALAGQIIYFCGPTKTPPGKEIGSCGPTTSKRMDPFSPALLKAGLSGMIGKGGRSAQVVDAIKKYRGVYFLAYAGCGALINQYVRSARVVAFAPLGPEAIYRLEVVNFPLIVGVDSAGGNVYERLNV